jgi:hypothetical protein
MAAVWQAVVRWMYNADYWKLVEGGHKICCIRRVQEHAGRC